jgi:drug/metabolite transporter (DMT)-like permease
LLTYIQILQLLSFTFLMSLGQILFKKTALSISLSMGSNNSLGLIEGLIKALSVPWLYMALCVYALSTVFWLYLLQRIPLSLAYPFSAFAMVIVPIVAVLIFGERLTWSYWIGVSFIVMGIIIIAR